MQKMETFTRPRLTIATEKLDALLVDDVAEALEHQLRRQWVQGAPRLHTRTTTEVHYPGRDLLEAEFPDKDSLAFIASMLGDNHE